MYVLVDMEWISNQHGNHWPTQLAAARVDAQWNTVDTFSVLFRPRDFSLQQWGIWLFPAGAGSSSSMEKAFMLDWTLSAFGCNQRIRYAGGIRKQVTCSICSPRYPVFLI